jgi:hypothetical protein
VIEYNTIVSDVYPLLKEKSSILFELTQDLVQPTFNESIPTARVGFDLEAEDKNVFFEFNPTFWSNLNIHEKFFVFVHEVLHVMFFHGSRGENFIRSLPLEKKSYDVLNQAMDITINELILREYIDVPLSILSTLQPMMCTISNCFPDREAKILRGKSFEYYYHELLKNQDSENGVLALDIHGFLETNLPPEALEKLESAIMSILEELNDDKDSKTKLSKNQLPSSSSNKDDGQGSGYSLDQTKTDQKVDFSTLKPVEKLEHHLNLFIAKKFGGAEPKPKYQSKWYGTNRRSHLSLRGTGMSLPIREEQIKKKGKHHIVIYCDVSGSVSSYSRMFMDLIVGLNEQKYDLDVYVFASYVHKAIRKETKISYSQPGSGTTIEYVLKNYDKEYIQKKNEPDAVVVLTDGQYSYITNKQDSFYEKWTFFMTRPSKNHPAKSSAVNLFQA